MDKNLKYLLPLLITRVTRFNNMKIERTLPNDKEKVRKFYENCEKRHKYVFVMKNQAKNILLKQNMITLAP